MRRTIGSALLMAALALQPFTAPRILAQDTPPDEPGELDGPNGIPCARMESLLFHVHAHVAVFVDGQPMEIPYGIGIGEPLDVIQASDGGPYVRSGSCFSWLHTHTPDGIIHIEAPIPRSFTLGDLFAVWGQPLSETQVASASGPVTAYLDGELVPGDPSEIPLWDKLVIQLNVGTDSPPPRPYRFPARYD